MAKVIIQTWQSNGQGRANSALATSLEQEYKDKCLIWNNGNFEPLKIKSYANNQSLPGLHGVELPLAMKFLNESPDETIYIIKHAQAGTNIDYHLPAGQTYETLLNSFIQPAINYLLANGIEPEIYIYLSGGEADSTDSRYLDFSEKLSKLVNNYRNIIGSEVHFISPLIIESGTLTRDTEINNVFRNFSKNDPKYSIIDSINFPSDDNLHWNYDGVNMLGEELFNIIQNNSGHKVKFPMPYNFNSGYVNVISNDTKFVGNLDLSKSSILNFPFQNKGYVYVDTSINNSLNSKLNNRYLPYASLSDAINALPVDNNFTWQIYFLNSGIIQGCELPFRNLEFYSEKAITIDFTSVNQGSSIMSNLNSLANSSNIIEYKFLSDNITLKSDYTGIQRFTNGNSYFKISGNIALDFKSNGGNNSNLYNFQSRVKTDLIIREWYCYSTHGAYILGFADGSNVVFEKIINVDLNNKYTLRETNFNSLHNANIIIKELNIQAGEFRSLLPISINKITGNGVVNSKKTTFNNCNCDNGISFNMINFESLSGKLISTNLITGSVSSVLKIRDFEGKINNLSITGNVDFFGNNEIDTPNFTITENANITVMNGITIVNGNISGNIIEKGILKIN